MSFWVTVKAITLIFISGRGSAISSFSRREIRFYLFGKEFISCLSCANLHPFHENPEVYTPNSHSFALQAHITKKSYAFIASSTNSVDPDQSSLIWVHTVCLYTHFNSRFKG